MEVDAQHRGMVSFRSRRASLARLALGLIAAVPLALSGCGDDDEADIAVSARPNIVWIVAEDMNFEIGAFGDSVATTPHLDRLAAEGVRYTNLFATSGVCAPARAALITGMYATSIGAHHMRSIDGGYKPVPPPDVKTFTEHLRAAGYYTSNRGKTDYQFSDVFGGAPPTNWDEPNGDWRGRAPGQPFFAYFTLLVTHEIGLFGEDDPVTDPGSVEVPPYYPDTPVVRRDFARLYDNVASMDEEAGRILEMLEQDGVADDTIVFFFTDNGRGFPRDKRWVYDGGIHVPMILRRPTERNAGTTDDRLLSFIDLPATVLSLAGVEVPGAMQGRPFLGPQRQPERDLVFAAADRHDEASDRIRAVRDKRYKYIRNYQPDTPYGQSIEFRNNLATMQEMFRLHDEGRLDPPAEWYFRSTKPVEELYDTEVDPYEIDNLANDPAMEPVLARMREAHFDWVARTGDLGAVPERELAERYWPGGVQPQTAAPTFETAKGASEGSIEVSLSSATEGASIAYALDGSTDPSWRLYDGPFEVDPGMIVRATAVRYGYSISDEVSLCAGKSGVAGRRSVTIESNGLQRTFELVVPDSALRGQPAPLVLLYHGVLADGDGILTLTGMAEKGAAEGFITVAGDGVGASWNAGLCCGEAMAREVDDVQFARDMVAAVEAEYCIDVDRIYATGFSNGAAMTFRLYCEANDLFAAFAPVAGSLALTRCEPSDFKPVEIVNNTDDPVVPFSLGNFSFVSSVGTNDCGDERFFEEPAENVTCEVAGGCGEEVRTALCAVEGLDHHWPGGARNPEGPFFATDYIWDIFVDAAD